MKMVDRSSRREFERRAAKPDVAGQLEDEWQSATQL